MGESPKVNVKHGIITSFVTCDGGDDFDATCECISYGGYLGKDEANSESGNVDWFLHGEGRGSRVACDVHLLSKPQVYIIIYG